MVTLSRLHISACDRDPSHARFSFPSSMAVCVSSVNDKLFHSHFICTQSGFSYTGGAFYSQSVMSNAE
jgi:hypothetical protein